MSQTIQHYQTCFTVKGGEFEGHIKLFQAQRVIDSWIRNHENRRFRDLGRNPVMSFKLNRAFFKRSKYSSKHSWCKTEYCLTDEFNAWAVEYTHRDLEEPGMYWMSEIGLRSYQDTGNLVISIRVSYKYETEYALLGDRPKPGISVPWVVRSILETFDGCEFFSGGMNVTAGIKAATTIATDEMARDVLAYLSSKDRKLAVILVLGETKEAKAEADEMSRNLFGKGLVYIIPYKPVKTYFRYYVKEFNECSIQLPIYYHDKNMLGKMRYDVSRKSEWDLKKDEILRAWLGVQPIYESGSVCSIENVQFWLRRHLFDKVKEELRSAVPSELYEKVMHDLKETTDLYQLSEEENESLRTEKDKLERKKEELENKNVELQVKKMVDDENHRQEIFSIKSKFDAESRRRSSAKFLLPRVYPDSFEALMAFQSLYQHLVFAENAWKAALDYRTFKDFNIPWEMLHDLDQILWPLVFEKRGNIEGEFERLSKYEYAKGEGAQTTNNQRLAQLRKFTFEGREYEMWTHLKHGNRPGKQLRIHFAIDNEKRRIIVGWIGEHMDNATTRSIH